MSLDPNKESEKNDPLDRNWTIIVRLLRLAWQYRLGCLKVLGFQVLVLGFALFGLGMTGLGVDVIRAGIDPQVDAPRWPFGWQPPADWSVMTVVLLVALLVLLSALVRAAANYGYTVSVAKLVQQQIVVDLRTRVYAKLQRLSFAFFDRHASGTIINRVTADVQLVRMFIDGVLLQTVILCISLGLYLFYMLNIHVPLTLACLATTPFLVWAALIFSRVVKPAYLRNRRLVDQMILRLAEGLQGIAVIKGFGREAEEVERFRQANRHVKEQQNWIFERVSIFSPSITFLTQINLMILLLYGGYLVMHDQLPLGTGLVVFAGLLQRLSTQVSNIANITNSMQRSLTSARRVFEILDAKVDIRDQPGAIPLPRAHGHIRYEHVYAEYEPGSTVLHDIDFEARPGQCVALLGATGSGKSALLSLLPRFYDPARGRILIDGHDLREVRLDDLRRNIGIVFQESFLFSNTVAANIAFGQPDASREQIEKAARIAAAHEFIAQLPQGYDTVLGVAGANLSGGQRQRIAIARALLLEPPILMLDDPTAAVDAQTEHEILEAMESAMQGRTTFVVAHRPSTLQRADFILVLDQGRIVQRGTHAELLVAGGPYRAAMASQLIAEPPETLAPATP